MSILLRRCLTAAGFFLLGVVARLAIAEVQQRRSNSIGQNVFLLKQSFSGHSSPKLRAPVDHQHGNRPAASRDKRLPLEAPDSFPSFVLGTRIRMQENGDAGDSSGALQITAFFPPLFEEESRQAQLILMRMSHDNTGGANNKVAKVHTRSCQIEPQTWLCTFNVDDMDGPPTDPSQQYYYRYEIHYQPLEGEEDDLLYTYQGEIFTASNNDVIT